MDMPFFVLISNMNIYKINVYCMYQHACSFSDWTWSSIAAYLWVSDLSVALCCPKNLSHIHYPNSINIHYCLWHYVCMYHHKKIWLGDVELSKLLIKKRQHATCTGSPWNDIEPVCCCSILGHIYMKILRY